MDGLVTLRRLRARGHKMPVIMCSSLTQRGARVTIEALASGASDYVAKPAGQAGREAAIRALAQELLPKIHALTAPAPAARRYSGLPCAIGSALRCCLLPPLHCPPASPSAVAIGVSTGGPAALDVLLPALPADFPLPVLIVQHMPEVFTRLFAERLNRRCSLRVCEASEGDRSPRDDLHRARQLAYGSRRRGRDWQPSHPAPQPGSARKSLPARGRRALSHRGRVYGSGVLAVVLTGMGSDGLAGSRLIRDREARSRAGRGHQHRLGHARRRGPGRPGPQVLPLDAIAPEILRIAGRARTAEIRNSRESGGLAMETAAIDDYGYLRELVFGLSRNVLDPSRDYLFETRLSKLLRNQGMSRLEELVRSLRASKNPTLERAIAEAMTINETSFFRDVRPFELLRTELLPKLIEARRIDAHPALLERRLLHRPGSLQPRHAAARALSPCSPAGIFASKAPTSAAKWSSAPRPAATTASRSIAACPRASSSATSTTSAKTGPSSPKSADSATSARPTSAALRCPSVAPATASTSSSCATSCSTSRQDTRRTLLAEHPSPPRPRRHSLSRLQRAARRSLSLDPRPRRRHLLLQEKMTAGQPRGITGFYPCFLTCTVRKHSRKMV